MLDKTLSYRMCEDGVPYIVEEEAVIVRRIECIRFISKAEVQIIFKDGNEMNVPIEK